jgi:hypothetical protein
LDVRDAAASDPDVEVVRWYKCTRHRLTRTLCDAITRRRVPLYIIITAHTSIHTHLNVPSFTEWCCLY